MVRKTMRKSTCLLLSLVFLCVSCSSDKHQEQSSILFKLVNDGQYAGAFYLYEGEVDWNAVYWFLANHSNAKYSKMAFVLNAPISIRCTDILPLDSDSFYWLKTSNWSVVITLKKFEGKEKVKMLLEFYEGDPPAEVKLDIQRLPD